MVLTGNTDFVSQFPLNFDDANLQVEQDQVPDPLKLQARDYNIHDVEIRQIQAVIGSGIFDSTLSDELSTALNNSVVALSGSAAAVSGVAALESRMVAEETATAQISVSFAYDAIVSAAAAVGSTHTSVYTAIVADGARNVFVLDGPIDDTTAGTITVADRLRITGSNHGTKVVWKTDGLTMQGDDSSIENLQIGDGGASDGGVTIDTADNIRITDVGIFIRGVCLTMTDANDCLFKRFETWCTSTHPTFTAATNFNCVEMNGTSCDRNTFKEFTPKAAHTATVSDANGIFLDNVTVDDLIIDGVNISDIGESGTTSAFEMGLLLATSTGDLRGIQIRNVRMKEPEGQLSYIVAFDSGVALNRPEVYGLVIDGVYSYGDPTVQTTALNMCVAGHSTLSFIADGVDRFNNCVVKNVHVRSESLVYVESVSDFLGTWIHDCDLSVPGTTPSFLSDPRPLIHLECTASGILNTRIHNIVGEELNGNNGYIALLCPAGGSSVIRASITDATDIEYIEIDSDNFVQRVLIDNISIPSSGTQPALVINSDGLIQDIAIRGLVIVDNEGGTTDCITVNSDAGNVTNCIMTGCTIRTPFRTGGNTIVLTAGGTAAGFATAIQHDIPVAATFNSGWTLGADIDAI